MFAYKIKVSTMPMISSRITANIKKKEYSLFPILTLGSTNLIFIVFSFISIYFLHLLSCFLIYFDFAKLIFFLPITPSSKTSFFLRFLYYKQVFSFHQNRFLFPIFKELFYTILCNKCIYITTENSLDY